MNRSAEAHIEGEEIVIRVPVENIQMAALGGWSVGAIDLPLRIDDPHAFAKAMCTEMNKEDEDGTTEVHRMLDAAIMGAVEWGEGEVITEDEAEKMIHEHRTTA